MISLDLVPSTVRQAAELLANSLSDNEREYFRITSVETLVGNFAGALRQGWSLWEIDTPLQRDAIKHYSIAHADDVSALIVHWARALVLDADFYPMEHCKRYHDHWAGSERRRWRLRDGRRGEGEERLLDLVAAGDHDAAGGVDGGAEESI